MTEDNKSIFGSILIVLFIVWQIATAIAIWGGQPHGAYWAVKDLDNQIDVVEIKIDKLDSRMDILEKKLDTHYHGWGIFRKKIYFKEFYEQLSTPELPEIKTVTEADIKRIIISR